jgi:hypothetical protein
MICAIFFFSSDTAKSFRKLFVTRRFREGTLRICSAFLDKTSSFLLFALSPDSLGMLLCSALFSFALYADLFFQKRSLSLDLTRVEWILDLFVGHKPHLPW